MRLKLAILLALVIAAWLTWATTPIVTPSKHLPRWPLAFPTTSAIG
jgi:hypothetical protein